MSLKGDGNMLGDTIKRERLASKMSQSQLANKLHVTQGAISQWENNITQPDIELLSKMSLLFNCSVPGSCVIGEGTKFGYGGISVVMHL